jgi:octaprenyl-diphosphate synthase
MSQTSENIGLKSISSAAELPLKAKLMVELAPIADQLQLLPEVLMRLLPHKTATAAKVSEHIFAAGGKRIRPALFLLCARMTGYTGENLLTVAAISEYVHTASLLHDDVVDDSVVRRGKPTANAIWGNQASVLVGDLVYATACELMAKTGKVELVTVFAEAIRKMSDGELLQMENAFHYNTTVDSYLEVLEGKTGVLIGASCAASGILKKLEQEKIQALYNFGNNLGIAFQLIDDALDYSITSEDFGKPTVADILEGKLTYPVLALKDLATPEELNRVQAALEKNIVTEGERTFIASLVSKYGTTEHTILKAQEYTSKAIDGLTNNFEDSEHRQRIERIAKLMLERRS